MDTSLLNSSEYWESGAIDLRLNPLRPVDHRGLETFLRKDCGQRGVVVLATSGSSGQSKFIVLKKSAILASADAVNVHCHLTANDLWLGGLSTFHVGGLGIYARAYRNGARVVPMAWDSWTRDGMALISAIEKSGATLTSLTPTHLWDLVAAKRRCPVTLRGVFLGGGTIDLALTSQALALEWPIWPTYGMTETSSQVATRIDEAEDDFLPMLPVWEARVACDGGLMLRGAALCEGWAEKREGEWRFVSSTDEAGWFHASDCCEIRDHSLRFLSRRDGAVKISGELISLSELNDRLRSAGVSGWIVALPDARRGNRLVLVREPGQESALAAFHESLAPIEQISSEQVVRELPRTDAGKPDRAAIVKLAEEGE